MPLTVTFKGLNAQQLKAAVQNATKDLLVIAERETLNFIKDRFRLQGWVGDGYNPWAKRKNDKRIGGAILVATGKLRNATHIAKRGTDFFVIANYMPYAQIHNTGFDGTEQVSAHKRKTFKDVMAKATSLKTGKVRTVKNHLHTGDVQVQAFTRHMHMPQRRFIGQSNFLDRRIEMVLKYELDKIK